MKTIRKTLCIVLVMTMIFGMAPYMALAVKTDDFPDAHTITPQLREAVDVLISLGVVIGSEGQINPHGTLTRAQAAIIIARMYLGSSAVENLAQTETGFTDVDGTSYASWAGPSIAWGVSYGIIKGTSATTFSPASPVRTVEFAILCLRLLGYGKKDEYSGNMWSTKAMADGLTHGVLTLGIQANDYATREQVMQYALNTLMKRIMLYNSVLDIYYPIGTNPLTMTPYNPDAPPVTLGRQTFGLTYDLQADELGHGMWNYNVNGQHLAGPYEAEGATADTYRVVVTDKHTTKYFLDYYSWNDTVELWINGGSNLNYSSRHLASSSVAQALPLGSVFSIYEENGKVKRVVIEYELLGRVSNITGGNATAKVYTDVKATPSYATTDFTFPAGDLSVGDYILIKPQNNAPQDGKTRYELISPKSDAPPIAPVKFTQPASEMVYKTAGLGAYDATITLVDGTEYKCGSDFRVLGFRETSLSFTLPTLFFFSSYDTLIGYAKTGEDITKPDASKKYVYVKRMEGTDGAGSSLITTVPAQAKAEVLFTDGSKGIVNLAIDGGMVIYIDSSGVTQKVYPSSIVSWPAGWYSYTTNSTGALIIQMLNGSTETQGVNISKAANSQEVSLSGGSTLSTTRASDTTALRHVVDGKATLTTGLTPEWSFWANTTNTYTLVVFTSSVRAIISEVYVISEAGSTTPKAREVVILTGFSGVVASGNEFVARRVTGGTYIVLQNPHSDFSGKMPIICELITATDGKVTAREWTNDATSTIIKDAVITVLDGRNYMMVDLVSSVLYFSSSYIEASVIAGDTLKVGMKVTCVFTTPAAGGNEVIALIIQDNTP